MKRNETLILADTTFIIDLINSESGAIAKAKLIDEDQIMIFISSITVQEYLRGIYYKFHSDEDLLQKKLYAAESDLARFQTIDFDYRIAKIASSIDADLTINGKQVGLADVIISATAKFYDLMVLTRNSDHFNRIKDLKVEEY